MRLGKHEKQVLAILRLYETVNPEWEWFQGGSQLRSLANPDDIERYRQGQLVSVQLILRGHPCGKSVMARTIKTLRSKGLILCYGADLSVADNFITYHTKFVGLTLSGRRIVDERNLKVLPISETLQS